MALLAIVAFAVTNLKIKTPDGNIIVRTEGGETEINVLGETAKFIDPADGKEVTVSIDKQAKKLRFSKNGFQSVGESFELGTDDQKVFVTFEPSKTPGKSESAAAKSEPVFAVAAFDNRQGVAYVFLSNGRYNKIDNGSNERWHQLNTNFYWKHAMHQGRDSKTCAILTEDYENSLIFFDDGMQAKYHNPSRVELDTRATENFAAGNDDLKASDICAAICLPDKRRFVFFKNGQCTRFDASMKPVETTSTETYFPNLKSKLDLLSAARVDPVTELAFFYFRDGSFQIYDTVEKETLGEFPMEQNEWKVPAKYLARAKPTKRIRSPNIEVVEWCFENGMTRLLCKPETKIINVDDASEFGDRLLPPVGGSINTDFENAHRTMLTLCRVALHGSRVPLESLTIHGSKPVSDQFLAEIKTPELHSLAIHCPITKQQLSNIPMRGIENFSMSHVTDELLETVTEHFPHLESLSINASQLSEGALKSLDKLYSLEKLEIEGEFNQEDLKRYQSEHPDVEIIVGKKEK